MKKLLLMLAFCLLGCGTDYYPPLDGSSTNTIVVKDRNNQVLARVFNVHQFTKTDTNTFWFVIGINATDNETTTFQIDYLPNSASVQFEKP